MSLQMRNTKTIQCCAALLIIIQCALTSSATENDTLRIGGRKAIVSVSSVLNSSTSDPDQYAGKNMFDGDSATCWGEGVQGDGSGEWVSIEFSKKIKIYGLSIMAGYFKSPDDLVNNNCAEKLEVQLDSDPPDTSRLRFRTYDIEPENSAYDYDVRIQKTGLNMRPALLPFRKTAKAKRITVRFLSVYSGIKYSDLCISELNIISKPEQIEYSLIATLNKYRNKPSLLFSENKCVTMPNPDTLKKKWARVQEMPFSSSPLNKQQSGICLSSKNQNFKEIFNPLIKNPLTEPSAFFYTVSSKSFIIWGCTDYWPNEMTGCLLCAGYEFDTAAKRRGKAGFSRMYVEISDREGW
jgi:hypothetical protein